MKQTIFSTVLLVLFSLGVVAQEEGHPDDHIHHDHHKNEIGVANALVYFVKEEVTAYGLHLHYIRTLNESKFGLGLGFEKIFDEHNHITYGIVGSYRPVEGLTFVASPGLMTEEDNPTARFTVHFETSYEFEIKNFHIGPVFEVAYDPEDIHVSLGVHVGFGF